MKKGAPALLAILLFAACASAPPPPPPPPEPSTPTEKLTAENTERGALIGRIIGTIAGVLTAADTGDLAAVIDLGDAGEAIGTLAGAAHGARIGSEFDRQESELIAIDGVDVARRDGDALEIRATAEAMPQVAVSLARWEREIELSATTAERARETVEVLVANGVDRDDITVHIDALGPDLLLRIR